MMQTQYGDVAVTLTDFVATVEIQRPPNNLLDIDLLRALAAADARSPRGLTGHSRTTPRSVYRALAIRHFWLEV